MERREKLKIRMKQKKYKMCLFQPMGHRINEDEMKYYINEVNRNLNKTNDEFLKLKYKQHVDSHRIINTKPNFY